MLHNLAWNCCTKCEVNPECLGELQEFPPRNHLNYKTKIAHYNRTQDPSAITDLTAIGLISLYNGFWALLHVQLSEIHKPDLLHNVYLGLLQNLLDCITACLKEHKRLDSFDEIWRSMPPYPELTSPHKAFREVSQWQGKEMRMFGRIVLVALAIALWKPWASQRVPFNCALRCVRTSSTST